MIQLQFQWKQPVGFAVYLKQDWLVCLKHHNKLSAFPLIFWVFFQCALSKYNGTNNTFKAKPVLTFLTPLSSFPLLYSDCFTSERGGNQAIWAAVYTFTGHRLYSDKWWLSFSSKKNKAAQETHRHLLWNNTLNVQGTTIKDWGPCEDLVETEMRYTSINHGQGMGFQPFLHKSWLFFQFIYLTGKEYLPSANVPHTSIRCSDVMAKKGKRQTGMPEGSY